MTMTPAEEHLKDLMGEFQKDFNLAEFWGVTPKEWRDNINKAANAVMLKRAEFSQIDLDNKNRKRRVA